MDLHDAVAAGRTAMSKHVHNLKHGLKRQPHPLPLISVTKGESLKLHTEELEKVMNQVEPGTPVAIISVVGAFRGGKSFLLSWFVRILSGSKTEQLGGGNDQTDGFSWSGGADPHTKGMTVWSKPFIRKVDDGKGGRTRMAVLLVDTEGLFDHKTNVKLDSCLFGLSTTLSSCQIFNVSNQVQADTLSNLAAYLELGTVAERDGKAPFQRLEILIRDWQNWKNWDDPCEGSLDTLHKDFKDYLDKILGNNNESVEGSSKESIEKDKINGCFRDPVGCFGLPYPGNVVTWRDFRGQVELIDRGFSRMVSHFIEKVILGKLKKTQACLPNRRKGQLVKKVTGWVELFNDGLSNGGLPSDMSWLGMMNETHNNKSIDEVFDKFKGDVAKQAQGYVKQIELNEVLAGLKRDAVKVLKLKGTEEVKKKAVATLKDKMDREGNRVQGFNRKRATRAAIVTEIVNELWKYCTFKGEESEY